MVTSLKRWWLDKLRPSMSVTFVTILAASHDVEPFLSLSYFIIFDMSCRFLISARFRSYVDLLYFLRFFSRRKYFISNLAFKSRSIMFFMLLSLRLALTVMTFFFVTNRCFTQFYLYLKLSVYIITKYRDN